MVVYRFEDSRSGACVARHLEGYRGIVQVDGYAAYHRLARPDAAEKGATLAACWAHVRRKFYELHVSDQSVVAARTLAQMGSLWAVEDAVRGQTATARQLAREETSAAVVTDLFAYWDRELPRLSQKSKLAEAIRYALTRRAMLERFLSDGRIELDSNTVERAIRPQAILQSFCPYRAGCRRALSLASTLRAAGALAFKFERRGVSVSHMSS